MRKIFERALVAATIGAVAAALIMFSGAERAKEGALTILTLTLFVTGVRSVWAFLHLVADEEAAEREAAEKAKDKQT